MKKLKALIQWFIQLELQEHRHWCHLCEADGTYNKCEHRSSCWMCSGVFCAGVERKNCPACEIRHCQSIGKPILPRVSGGE